MTIFQPSPGDRIAVLASGGLDSAVLLSALARHDSAPEVTPIFVAFGLVWEQAELRSLRRFLAATAADNLRPLREFRMPLDVVYGDHWSATGRHIPGFDAPDEAVFLPGRNLLLLAQPAIWCHLNGIEAVALGHLGSNPFSDSSGEFFDLYERAINQATGGRLRTLRPFERLSKTDVLRLAGGLPLEHTFSCLRPVGELHCGDCNKCAERQRGFETAGLPDPTIYASVGRL